MLFYDDTEHPLVRMTIVGIRTREDNAAYMDRVDALLDAGDQFALVVDDRSTGNRSARGRSGRVLQWAVGRRARFKRRCVGMAIVVDELNLVRTVRAPRVLQPVIPVPVSVFSDTDMAVAWVHSRLAACAGRQVLEQYAR